LVAFGSKLKQKLYLKLKWSGFFQMMCLNFAEVLMKAGIEFLEPLRDSA